MQHSLICDVPTAATTAAAYRNPYTTAATAATAAGLHPGLHGLHQHQLVRKITTNNERQQLTTSPPKNDNQGASKLGGYCDPTLVDPALTTAAADADYWSALGYGTGVGVGGRSKHLLADGTNPMLHGGRRGGTRKGSFH